MNHTDRFRLIHLAPDVHAAQAEARAEFLYRIRAWSEGQLTLDRLTADKWWPATARRTMKAEVYPMTQAEFYTGTKVTSPSVTDA